MTQAKTSLIAALTLTAILTAGCATKSEVPSGATSTNVTPAKTVSADAPRKVKSRDGKFEGDVRGTPIPGNKFSKLEIGMKSDEVQDLLDRAPDRSHSYESGKRWIPFYFGADARRTESFFKGEGCLTFTGGNVWGGGGGTLIGIAYDPSGVCYKS